MSGVCTVRRRGPGLGCPVFSSAPRLVPRSIRYRLVYPDQDFQGGIPKPLRRLTRSELGRNLIESATGSRLFGHLLYRYWSLPLTVLAQKRDGQSAV